MGTPEASGPTFLRIALILYILFIQVKKVLALCWSRHCRAVSSL
jgi:hypothetical protein